MGDVVIATVHDTKRPRAGRRFEPTHERALHGDALLACESLPGVHRGVLVIREMVGPLGIPDLTALVGDLSVLDARLSSGIPPVLSQLDAAIVAATSVRMSRAPVAIATSLGWPVATVERRLLNLVRTGALTMSPGGGLRRPASMRPVGRLYAVEAKVRDRRAAIQQARTYGVWADSYVLVMGEMGSRPRAELLQDVSSDRGGLMVAGDWLRRPVMQRLSGGRRLWASEHLVAAVSGESYQPSVLA